jgi:hypothetical protein
MAACPVGLSQGIAVSSAPTFQVGFMISQPPERYLANEGHEPVVQSVMTLRVSLRTANPNKAYVGAHLRQPSCTRRD